MLLRIEQILDARPPLPSTGSTAAAVYSDEGSPTATTVNTLPTVLSILCWNIQVFDSLKAERNPVVNAVIRDVLFELRVDICFLLETREHPEANMNIIEPTDGEDLVYQQVGSELTGSLRCPPHRLYPPDSGGSFLDVEYTEERQRSWRLPRRLYATEVASTSAASTSVASASAETDEAEEESQDGPADWLTLYRDELFRYYDLYAVKPGEPQEVDWPVSLPANHCLLDKEGRIFYTKTTDNNAPVYLIHCNDASEKDKPKTSGRVKYMKLSRGDFKVDDLRSYKVKSLDQPARQRFAHDGLDDLAVSSDSPFGFALLAGGLQPPESLQDTMFIFEHKGTSNPAEDFLQLCTESEGRWFKHSWKEELRDKWRDKFNLYLAGRDTFREEARNEWQWISVIPAGPPGEGIAVFQLRKCGTCGKYLGDPWSACSECLDLRSGTERENLRQTLQSNLGGAGWSGFETYSALVRCNSSTRAGAAIPLEGKKALVLRSFNRLLDVDKDDQPLGYIKPRSTFYGRCPFLLPVRFQPISGGTPIDLPVIAFHAPYGQATKAGIKARADSMLEIFKAQISYLPGKSLLEDYENALILGDFNLDVSQEAAVQCYSDYESHALLPKVKPGTKTTLQKLDKKHWPALKAKAPETDNYLSSSYDNIFLKSSALTDACGACVVDVIAYIQDNQARYIGLVDEYFVQHPKSGKKADWELFKADPDLMKHVGAYIYASFVSDHLPVIADLKVQAGSLAIPEAAEEEPPIPLLVERIEVMLQDLEFDVADLNEAVKAFEEWSGVPGTGKVNWITYWRILARWDPEQYEKEVARIERPSRWRRRLAMGPSDFAKRDGLAAVQEEEASTKAADVSGL